jgi:hypothetical protein
VGCSGHHLGRELTVVICSSDPDAPAYGLVMVLLDGPDDASDGEEPRYPCDNGETIFGVGGGNDSRFELVELVDDRL